MGKKKLYGTLYVQLFLCVSILIDTYFLSCNYSLWLKANDILQLLLVVKANEWRYYKWRTQNLVSLIHKTLKVNRGGDASPSCKRISDFMIMENYMYMNHVKTFVDTQRYSFNYNTLLLQQCYSLLGRN